MRIAVLFCLLTVAIACEQPRAASMPAKPAEAATTADAVGASRTAASLDCGAPIAGVAPLLVPGNIVMLGEIHGTVEIPAFVGDLACQALARGHRVLLGLEYPASEHSDLEAYLASDGGPTARRALLAGAHWQTACPDGRSSQAIFDLVERARALRQDRHRIDLFAFDPATYHDWNRRDAGMAENILARAADAPNAIVLTLTGNLHNRLTRSLPWDDSLVPAGVQVAATHGQVISLDVRHAGGTAWIQRSANECGPADMAGKPVYAKRYVEVGEETDNDNGSGVFSVGPVSAAPPAVGQNWAPSVGASACIRLRQHYGARRPTTYTTDTTLYGTTTLHRGFTICTPSVSAI